MAAATAAIMMLAGTFGTLFVHDPETGRAQGDGTVYITLTNGKETASAGEAMTYRITLQQHEADWKNVAVTLRLPPHVGLISATEGGSVHTDNTVHWNSVAVHKGNVKVLTVNATVNYGTPSGTVLAATASIAGGHQATDVTRIEGTQAITGSIHLSLTNGKRYVMPGERLHYTLRVRNNQNVTRTDNVSVSFPQYVTFVSASEGGVSERSDSIVWRNITLAPGEERNFTFVGQVYERAKEHVALTTTAMMGGYRGSDDTYVSRGIPSGHITARMFSDRQSAERGDLITYTIEMRNQSDRLGVEEYVNAAMPIYAEFVDVREGGYWDGKNIRWSNIQIAPHGVRRLSFVIRVRSDAPIGAELLASVQVEGGYDASYVRVVGRGQGRGPLDGYDPSESTRHATRLLLRKVPGSDEAIPGTDMHYTIFVQNMLDRPISHMRIADRYDPAHLTFGGANRPPVRTAHGELEWTIPVLQPGERWEVSYTLAVSPHAPSGYRLTNIATISGPDIDHLPLTERVRTVHTGVLTRLPTTGAAWDALFMYASFFLAGGSLATQQIGKKFVRL